MAIVTVLTADVVESRRQDDLRRFLAERLARLRHPLLETAFTVSRGDEIQGVCRGALEAPELARWLRYHCRPLVLRLGIGIGASPEEKAVSSWDMNGEAFFRARAALERLKSGKSPRTLVVSGDEQTDTIANALFELMDATLSRWTGGQWEAVAAYERDGTYEAAGAVLGIALQNVEKRCRAARWPAVRTGEAALRKLGGWRHGRSPLPG
jgi:hypothetical protein